MGCFNSAKVSCGQLILLKSILNASMQEREKNMSTWMFLEPRLLCPSAMASLTAALLDPGQVMKGIGLCWRT